MRGTTGAAAKPGVSSATFHRRKARFGGPEAAEAENPELKRMLADAILDKAALKDLPGKE